MPFVVCSLSCQGADSVLHHFMWKELAPKRTGFANRKTNEYVELLGHEDTRTQAREMMVQCFEVVIRALLPQASPGYWTPPLSFIKKEQLDLVAAMLAHGTDELARKVRALLGCHPPSSPTRL